MIKHCWILYNTQEMWKILTRGCILYVCLVFSNACHVLSQWNTRLRLFIWKFPHLILQRVLAFFLGCQWFFHYENFSWVVIWMCDFWLMYHLHVRSMQQSPLVTQDHIHNASISLLISLLNFLMSLNTTLTLQLFLSSKPALVTYNQRRRDSEIYNATTKYLGTFR